MAYRYHPSYRIPVFTHELAEEDLKMTEEIKVDVTKETVYAVLNEFDLSADYVNNKSHITDEQVAVDKAIHEAKLYNQDQYVAKIVRVVKVVRPEVEVIEVKVPSVEA